MAWSVAVKIETQGNGDEKTMSETIFPTYAEAFACAQMYEIQGRVYLSINWDEVGPPKWEVNFMGLEFRIIISEVEG
jgi:hypothetical protein